MADQLHRHLDLLRCLPKAANPISTSQVHQRLKDLGYSCAKRTVERDLNQLLDYFPQAVVRVSGNEAHPRAYLWGLKDGKAVLPETLLGKPELALAMTLLKQQAYSRLPLRIFNLLKPLWDQAAATSEQHRDSQQWLSITRYLPNPLRPQSPSIVPAVQEAIETALLSGDALHLTLATLDGELQFSRLLPLRLLQQEEIMYLLAENTTTTNLDEQICVLPMHRIIAAKTCLSLDGGSGIDPDLAQSYALKTGERLQLHLCVSRQLAEALFDRPLGSGQVIKPSSTQAGWYELTTVIEDSPQLQQWLKNRERSGDLSAIHY